MGRGTRNDQPDKQHDEQHFRQSFRGMNAHQRHQRLMNDFMHYYGGAKQIQAAGGWEGHHAARTAAMVRQSDMEALKEGHRFIRTAEDDVQGGLPARLARKYYDRLFREYCIADLSRYKESKVGMRWRTQQEVISGKGQFVCGSKACDAKDGLASFEVNFSYSEAGQNKQALVKLRLCPDCAYKLNYKKESQYRLVQAKQLQQGGSKADRKRPREAAADDAVGSTTRRRPGPGFDEPEDKEWVVAPAGKVNQQGGEGAGGAQQQQQAQMQAGGSVLSADPSVWEAKPAEAVATVDEELDAYLESMFM